MATLEDILGGGLPAGLLSPEQEAIANQRAQNAGLLNIALGMLQASRGQPGMGRPSLGQIVGQAGPAGVQGYQQSFEDTLKRTLQGMQIAEAKRKQQVAEQLRALAPSLVTTTPGVPEKREILPAETGDISTVTQQARPATYGINMQALPALAALGPEGMDYASRVAAFQKSMQPDYITVGDSLYLKKPEGGVEKVVNAEGKFTGDFANMAVGMYGTANAQDILAKDPNAFGRIQSGVLAKAEAARPSVTVTTEKSYGGALAGKVAESDAAKFEAAQSAPRVIETAQSTRALIEKGNVLTGIGAQQRLDLARFGDVLGVTGKDTKETIANTQQLFQNRAQATLDSIKSSGLGSGQGFSNKDREFLENAKLGNITYSKEALLRQIDLEERVGKATIDMWNSRLDQIPAEARASLGLPKIQVPTARTSAIKTYNPATGRVE